MGPENPRGTKEPNTRRTVSNLQPKNLSVDGVITSSSLLLLSGAPLTEESPAVAHLARSPYLATCLRHKQNSRHLRPFPMDTHLEIHPAPQGNIIPVWKTSHSRTGPSNYGSPTKPSHCLFPYISIPGAPQPIQYILSMAVLALQRET